jgi:hypothetical protein
MISILVLSVRMKLFVSPLVHSLKTYDSFLFIDKQRRICTARPDGAFLFVVWFIHWKHMIRPFLFIDKQKRKLSIHELVVDFWLANVTKLDDQNRILKKLYPLINDQYTSTVRPDEAFRVAVGSFIENVWFVLVYRPTKTNMLTLMLHETILIIWFSYVS